MQPPQPPYGSPPPPPGMGGYGPPPGPPGPSGPGWGPPGPPGPPRRNNNAAVIIVIIAVAVVLIGGGVGIVWLYNKGEDAASAVASPTPSFPTLPSFSAPAVPSFTPEPTPSFPEETPSPAFDPQPGDCVRNTGTFHKPILNISGCTPGHYRIIDRVDGTTNKNRCNGTGYTYAVWYYSPEFLLCMRRL